MSRPTSDRDGPCICDYGPNTDGPQEDCPFHGRPYAYWIARGDALQARLDAVLALAAEWEEWRRARTTTRIDAFADAARAIRAAALARVMPDDPHPTTPKEQDHA